MRYAIVGTGGIGGYYGAQLAKAGKEVHFLLRSDYETVRDNGLQIDSVDGSYHLDHINAYNNTEDMPKCDVVIVALKTTANGRLQRLLTPLLHKDTLVLLIQNGIGVEEDVQKIFPETYLAAGLAFICTAKTAPGIINHQAYGSITIGNYSCPKQELVNSLIADLADAGVQASDVEYLEARWKKAVWNMPFNGMTVALETTTASLLANPSTRRLIEDMMMEVVGGARACGCKTVDEEFVKKMIDITLVMPPYKPSMKLDHDFNRPMEIDYIYSRPIADAKKHGFHMAKLEMLEAELRFIESVSRERD